MVALEHEAGLRQTTEMIRRDPVDAVFTRTAKLATTAGGTRSGAPVDTAPQHVRLMPAQTETTQIPRVVTSSGALETPSYVILALPGVDIRVGDRATIDGKKLEVVWFNDEPGWRWLFECVEKKA